MTHTFFGAALADTGLARSETNCQRTLTTATLLLGANLPDVDAFTYFLGADVSLEHRRGWTHGVLAWIVLPVVLTLLVLAYDRWRRRRGHDRPAANPRRILALATVAVLSHPLLDWLNTYGIRLLMPFDGRWFYGDTLYIVDPWIWLTLGGVLFLNHSESRRALLRWASLGLVTTAFLFLVTGPHGWAFWLWTGVVAALIVVRLRRRGAVSEESRRRRARFAVGACVVYIGLMLGLTSWVTHEVKQELESADVRTTADFMVGPDRLDPFLRFVVVPTSDAYRVASYHLLRRPRFDLWVSELPLLRPRTLPGVDASDVLAAARTASCVRGMVDWVRYPFYEIDVLDDGFEVFILDARYVDRRTRGFGGAAVEVGSDLVPSCDAH